MAEDSKPNDGAIPPRFSLKQSGIISGSPAPAGTPGDAKRKTSRVEITPPPQESQPTLKKKTSRIPLEHVTAETGAAPGSPVPGVGLGTASKTIRLTPAAPPPPSFSIPASSPINTAKGVPGGSAAEDIKRQTSRISLDSVLGERTAGGVEVTTPAGAPKTIRIKRPSLTQAIRPASGAAETGAPPLASGVDAAKSTTSRLELTEESQPEGQATQRKTIKIRRVEGGVGAKPGPRSMVVARIETEMAEHEAAQAAQASFHVFFPIAAAVAVIVLCFMAYILLAQVFPNPSLGYPGKITL